jgi:hypothetical protein
MSRFTQACVAALPLWIALPALGQDANITLPIPEIERQLAARTMVIQDAEISRPKAKGDITLRADVSFDGGAPMRVKLRKAEPGADEFNNVPRYDLAAYELQKLLFDPPEYVVPPTTLRMVPYADFHKFASGVKRTFPPGDEVLGVVQYWLSDIKVIADVYDPERFERDPAYARHIGQLNIFTHLIQHRDSNAGNFLIGRAETGARVFSIDHGVAFSSKESDRGMLWLDMRVNRLPADAVARLRALSEDVLRDHLGVLAQWQLVDRHWVPVALGENLSSRQGVRHKHDQLQMGLTLMEIQDIERIRVKLLDRIDKGEFTTVEPPARSHTP